jgi:hypothetical protein
MLPSRDAAGVGELAFETRRGPHRSHDNSATMISGWYPKSRPVR